MALELEAGSPLARTARRAFRAAHRNPRAASRHAPASIRNCAAESRVSRSTVVEAYDRLIAAGLIESRRGSGFYVRRAPTSRRGAIRGASHARDGARRELAAARAAPPVARQRAAGAGLLPENWLDHEMVAAAVRGVGRSRGSWILKYGAVEGYLPLREALATRLAHIGIGAPAEQIITTAGATEAIDLVARAFPRAR
jgi:DNA-binding transcriptional MocR family regulator